MNDETERIIAAFESLDHSDSDDNLEYGAQEYYISDVLYRFPPLPPGDDIDENTDTDDGAEDLTDLLKANMKLMNILHKQQDTIARLRTRIARL
jgi:hypothetical protein